LIDWLIDWYVCSDNTSEEISPELQQIVAHDMSVDKANPHHRVGADVCVRKEYRMLTRRQRQGNTPVH